MSPLLLIVLFAASAVLGYVIIRNVPALLHTPLMSGMNALSGVTVLGAIIAAFQSKGILALILVVIISLCAGVVMYSPKQLLEMPDILRYIRLPRTIAAVCAGAGLAGAEAAWQAARREAAQ